MEPFVLATETRTETGNGPARRLRARGLIPGILYGKGSEAVMVAVTPKLLTQALSTPYRRNTLLKVEVGGKSQLAMLKELQVHPVSRQPLHFDLFQVDMSKPVRADVPFTTEGRAKGVVLGGEVNVIYRTLPVRTTPDKIPAEIKIDVTNMNLGDAIKTKDLQLGAGIEVLLEPERSLITCAEPRALLPEEEEGKPAAGAEGAAPAAAAAGTPAAAAAKPAGKPSK